MAKKVEDEKKIQAHEDVFTLLETFEDQATASERLSSKATNTDPNEPKSYKEALARPEADE